MHQDISEILYTEEQLRNRVKELGAQITEDYHEKVSPENSLLLVSLLRGGAMFMTDLARSIDLPTELDFMVVSSYGAGTKSSGKVDIIKDITANIEGRHVLLAEDVYDSGITLDCLMKVLAERNPASLQVAVCLRKRVLGQLEVPMAYTGFECPEAFVVGYGLDYNQRYRNLPYVGVLKPEVYTK